ncbi:glycoside hydrolase family 25 protein [Tieghemostelium lacteum]|uniref:lysozyme n=1 Tax=Tieghemostelium lacteum TaxID=361077 RepID=A0A152A2E1_TIELA|nr:glycoside hydrolase family 25 protein [Tieghemostelium lacteum]|eukprot:KYR00374.1 glycoside hydrolase family 25 protein [Tieghemostelium lacteum]
MNRLLTLFALVVLLKVATATIGVDISSASDVPAFQCLKNEGYDFAIIRAWESVGQPDSNGPHSVYNAWEGGMADVDIYVFPCFSCGNGYGQVQSAIKYVQSYNAKFGMVWFDIEGPGTYWGGDQSSNAAFFADMVSGAQALGAHIGIYTSASQWIPIMGGYTGGSGFPLWYAHYDDNPSFSDFSPFGGWTAPAIKQYNGDLSVCGLGIDANWYP